MRRPSEQMVKTIGVKIHANLPALPMMMVCELEQVRGSEWKWMSDDGMSDGKRW